MMWKRQWKWKSRGLLTLCLQCTVACASDKAPSKTDAEFSAAMEELARGGMGVYVARERFLAFPPEKVIPAVVTALRENPGFENGQVRAAAYQILLGFHKETVASPLGRDQCISGLQDRYGCGTCATVLLHVATEHRREVVEAFAPILDQNELCRNSLLHTLEQFGPDALPLLPRIEAMFNDPNEEKVSRSISARVMVNALGIETALERFQGMGFDRDRIGAISALFAIGQYAAEKKARLESLPEPKRRQAVDFVLTALPPLLTSDDVEERDKLGLDAMVLTFYVVASGMADHDPKAEKVMSILRNMALHDSEPRIQKRAGQFVGIVPAAMEEIQEIRAKAAPVAP